MSESNQVNTVTGEVLFRVHWRRLALVAAAALAAVILLTPLTSLAGFGVRRSSVTILRFAFLFGLALSARDRLRDESALFRCSKPLLVWLRHFLMGAGALGLYLTFLLLIGERELEPVAFLRLLGYGGKYLPLALVIGFLEDLLFFGFLFAACGRRGLAPALIYAFAHFLAPAKGAAYGEVGCHGLEALAQMGGSLAGSLGHPIEVVGLFLLGWVLVSLRRASGSVWTAMGVHGGLYWVRQVARKFSDDVEGRLDWLFGSDRICDGVLGWVAILATGVIVMRATERRALLRGEEEG